MVALVIVRNCLIPTTSLCLVCLPAEYGSFIEPFCNSGSNIIECVKDQTLYYVTLGVKSLHGFSQLHTKLHTRFFLIAICVKDYENLQESLPNSGNRSQ